MPPSVTYHVNPRTGDSIAPGDAQYITKNLLLIVEDDLTLLNDLKDSAIRTFRARSRGQDTANDLVKLCATSSVPEVKTHLANYMQHSPDARIYVSLDHNMGLNTESAKRKPTEALLFDPYFQHYLRNGGAVVSYTGYPEQVLQSENMMTLQRQYDKIAFFIAKKADEVIEHDHVFRLLADAVLHPDKLDVLRRIAEASRNDLGEAMRMQARAAKRRKSR